MPTIRIPTPLRSYTDGQTELALPGDTVSEVMDELTAQYPSLRQHLFNGKNELRPFVNLFLNGENIKELQGLETGVQEGDQLLLIPSIAGG